ncbi:hypothetical protein QZH41_002772 [Actinostola sp. cb2023]|nr:hypothetical protein QZH41_002772 [Actinostola sp. cb2023]
MDEEEFYYFDELTDDLDLANAAKTYEEQMTGKEKDDEDDEMINSFLQAQKSRNTEYKTKSDMKTWKRFCQSNEEERKMEDIPLEELNKLFCKFFISVRKQDGGEYEPGTLSGFQRSFQRYLQEKGSSYNILKDNEFSKSRNVYCCQEKEPHPPSEKLMAAKLRIFKIKTSPYKTFESLSGNITRFPLHKRQRNNGNDPSFHRFL